LQGKNKNTLTCTDRINSFQENLKLWGARIIKEKNVEMFELTKCCRLGKNLVAFVLQNLSLLSKNTEKYFPSLDVSSLGWVRDFFVLSEFE
jgi:hypothetical protein